MFSKIKGYLPNWPSPQHAFAGFPRACIEHHRIGSSAPVSELLYASPSAAGRQPVSLEISVPFQVWLLLRHWIASRLRVPIDQHNVSLLAGRAHPLLLSAATART